MQDTSKSVLEIALDAGYAEEGNFCRAFKKRYGLSPFRYRQEGGCGETARDRLTDDPGIHCL
jgi:AraC-like DNA-binding protein